MTTSLETEFVSYLFDLSTAWQDAISVIWPVLQLEHWRWDGQRPVSDPIKAPEHQTPTSGHVLGHAYEQWVHASNKHNAQGIFYTPTHILHTIFAHLPPHQEMPSLLDPACGCGAFLIEALHVLPSRGYALADVFEQLHGVDLDSTAIAQTRRGVVLSLLALSRERPPVPADVLRHVLAHQLICADALDLALWSHRQFDCIVGNPPYVLLQAQDNAAFESYARANYVCATYKVDLYPLFFERTLSWLAPGGWFALITPKTFLTNTHMVACRRMLTEQATIQTLIDMQYPVFPRASVDTVITMGYGSAPTPAHEINILHARDAEQITHHTTLAVSSIKRDASLRMNVHHQSWHADMMAQIASHTTALSSWCFAYFGVQTNHRPTYVSDVAHDPSWLPCVDGGDLLAFSQSSASAFVCTLPEAIKSGGRASVHQQQRIGVRQIGHVPIAGIIEAGTYSLNTVYNVCLHDFEPSRLYTLLGWLNSALIGWIWRTQHADAKRTFPKIKKAPLLALPAPVDGLELAPLVQQMWLCSYGAPAWHALKRQIDQAIFEALDIDASTQQRIWEEVEPWLASS